MNSSLVVVKSKEEVDLIADDISKRCVEIVESSSDARLLEDDCNIPDRTVVEGSWIVVVPISVRTVDIIEDSVVKFLMAKSAFPIKNIQKYCLKMFPLVVET